MPGEDDLLHYLAENKLNITQQRLEIANLFLALPGHHSLEELYLLLRERTGGKVGQTTVYRTIRLLCEAGLAREVLLADGSARYEPDRGRAHHDHMLCRQCGKLVEFVDDTIERLQVQIAERFGFVLQGHHLLLFGLCPDCRARQDTLPAPIPGNEKR